MCAFLQVTRGKCPGRGEVRASHRDDGQESRGRASRQARSRPVCGPCGGPGATTRRMQCRAVPPCRVDALPRTGGTVHTAASARAAVRTPPVTSAFLRPRHDVQSGHTDHDRVNIGLDRSFANAYCIWSCLKLPLYILNIHGKIKATNNKIKYQILLSSASEKKKLKNILT